MGTLASMPARPAAADDRGELRAAIAAVKAKQAVVAAHQDAINRGRTILAAAEAALAKAQEQVASARTREAKRLAASARGDAAPRSGSADLREARAVFVGAEDQVEAALAAVQQLENADLADLQEDLNKARCAVLGAVAELLAPIADQYLEQAKKAKRDYLIAREILTIIVTEDRSAPALQNFRDEMAAREARQMPLMSVAEASRNFFARGLSNDELFGELSAVQRNWSEARARLANDADAMPPLPRHS